jgi:hypothetical protein
MKSSGRSKRILTDYSSLPSDLYLTRAAKSSIEAGAGDGDRTHNFSPGILLAKTIFESIRGLMPAHNDNRFIHVEFNGCGWRSHPTLPPNVSVDVEETSR